MGKGFDKNRERLDLLNSFGRSLVRRSKSCCELCGHSETPLLIHELEPVSKEPELERCFFICEDCKDALKKKNINSDYWRFLSESIWSEVPVIQAQSYKILECLSSSDHIWASELLDQVYLSEEVSILL